MTLVKWTLPSLSVNVPIDIPLAEIPVGPFDVNVVFTGDVGLTFQATVGLDTSGIKKGNLLDGLFFGTTQPLCTATFSIGAAVEAGVYIVNVGFDFQLGSSVSFGFANLNNDGEIYLDQIEGDCAFEESGDVFVEGRLPDHVRHQHLLLHDHHPDRPPRHPVQLQQHLLAARAGPLQHRYGRGRRHPDRHADPQHRPV